MSKMFVFSKYNAVCSFLFSLLFFAFGGSERLVLVLFVLIVIDALMALIVVAKTTLKFSSAKLSRSLYKMGVYSLLIIGSHQIDKIMNVPNSSFLPDAPIVWLILSWAAATQFLSILEHANELGFRIPHKLFSKIKKISE